MATIAVSQRLAWPCWLECHGSASVARFGRGLHPCVRAVFSTALAQARQFGPPTARPPAMWQPRRCRRLASHSGSLLIGSVQSRQARVRLPISLSGRWRQQDHSPAACIRPNMIAVAVRTFETCQIHAPTTSVLGEDQFIAATERSDNSPLIAICFQRANGGRFECGILATVCSDLFTSALTSK